MTHFILELDVARYVVGKSIDTWIRMKETATSVPTRKIGIGTTDLCIPTMGHVFGQMVVIHVMETMGLWTSSIVVV